MLISLLSAAGRTCKKLAPFTKPKPHSARRSLHSPWQTNRQTEWRVPDWWLLVVGWVKCGAAASAAAAKRTTWANEAFSSCYACNLSDRFLLTSAKAPRPLPCRQSTPSHTRTLQPKCFLPSRLTGWHLDMLFEPGHPGLRTRQNEQQTLTFLCKWCDKMSETNSYVWTTNRCLISYCYATQGYGKIRYTNIFSEICLFKI